MASVKAFYLIERFNEGQANDGRYFVDVEFAICYDPLFNDIGAPERFNGRFFDYKRAQDLIKRAERVALLITDFEGHQTITLAATLKELEPFMLPVFG